LFSDLQFTPESIDANMCTHLIYSFVGLNSRTNRIGSMDPWLDYTPDESEEMEDNSVVVGGLSKLNKLLKKCLTKYLYLSVYFSNDYIC